MTPGDLAGLTGRLSGAVRPGRIGDVMLAVGDRVEAHYAVACRTTAPKKPKGGAEA
jgi:hypothetical protein